MARTKSTVSAPKKRIRRNEEQLIADLELEIQRIKARAAAKTAKKDPATKHTTDAVRSIDLALSSASKPVHREALSEARTVLVAYLQMEGVKIPQKRGRKRGSSRANLNESTATLAESA